MDLRQQGPDSPNLDLISNWGNWVLPRMMRSSSISWDPIAKSRHTSRHPERPGSRMLNT